MTHKNEKKNTHKCLTEHAKEWTNKFVIRLSLVFFPPHVSLLRFCMICDTRAILHIFFVGFFPIFFLHLGHLTLHSSKQEQEKKQRIPLVHSKNSTDECKTSSSKKKIHSNFPSLWLWFVWMSKRNASEWRDWKKGKQQKWRGWSRTMATTATTITNHIPDKIIQ